ncbi:isoleucine--tRNA ligase [Methylocapsa sp. S129]|uniref:isoleucine--tRNA ligase n=1 Tax=Methylocapsa sp. S129 TaxID=1641869 RepID=UPI00131CF6D1|nr:isoleucine--tRNA ligase [Methylocapsa sp. S129]
MNQQPAKGPDYTQTLFLPKTDFPMRAGLPQKEPEILARWQREDLYGKLRASARGRAKFVLHDGPPYANGNIHIGHSLNKILKDMVVRAHQMSGKDSNYVPGWDCHGLPIEWKIEEENYRSKGKTKPDFSDPEAIIAFRRECRAYAEHWVSVQREEFKRLGVVGDWDHPYLTMSYPAEAQIAREIFKFVANGLLYRGSKPVMWSVVEKTALAEAEIEYEEHTSDTVYVAFPVEGDDASVVIWTTTPWTMPGNRAIAFSHRVAYGRYRVTQAPTDNWAKVGATYILAQSLAPAVFAAAKVEAYELVGEVGAEALAAMTCAHPLRERGYGFVVPLLDGDHVTEEAGTGFVHTAPGHGREDFELWMANGRLLAERGIDARIPYTVDEDGMLTEEAPGFEGHRVITDKGEKGDANEAVMKALIAAGRLVSRGRLKHQYPHSWRSKKPVIFRNTPQWFLAMDRPYAAAPQGRSLRAVALDAIKQTRWVPAAGENRINGMVASKPDWVLSRQRAWGVPLPIFVRKGEHDVLYDQDVNARIADAFDKEGADAWFAEGAKERFLGPGHKVDDYDKIDNLVEVWFDSGSTHAFVLEDPVHFPGLAGIHRKVDGGADEVMYLEGSDQHRGWFQSSLLESCGTRGRAPFDVVLTHGFTLDEKGRKMSKSLGNQTFPQDIIKQSGADILRLWVASVDYTDDQRIGPEVLKSVSDNYRKLRNTLRWMIGTLAHYSPADAVGFAAMADLDRLMLHRLAELGADIQAAYADFDYARVIAALSAFMNSDLSAFYFDIRKDALYCDPPSSPRRRGALEAIDHIFRAVTLWLAPILVFTSEEAWGSYDSKAQSVHLEQFPAIPAEWRDEALAAKWDTIRRLRLVVTGAIEIARANKEIGSSLEARPRVFIADKSYLAALEGVDFAEVCITSDIAIETSAPAPDSAFRLSDTSGVAVVVERAPGVKCARSWKYFDPTTADPAFPDVTPRDAQALRELKAAGALS